MANKLIVIGWMGIKRAYLNISREDAIGLYKRSGGGEVTEDMVKEFEFNVEFGVYDAYACN